MVPSPSLASNRIWSSRWIDRCRTDGRPQCQYPDPATRALPPDVGAFGKACTNSAVSFVSRAALDANIGETLGLDKQLLAVKNTRGGIGKSAMKLNDATPDIEVNPETYEVRADGELLTCEPATELPMAQRYFLY